MSNKLIPSIDLYRSISIVGFKNLEAKNSINYFLHRCITPPYSHKYESYILEPYVGFIIMI